MRLVACILLVFFVQISFFAQELPTKVERDQMLIGELNYIVVQHKGALSKQDLLAFKKLYGKPAQSTEKNKSDSIEIDVYRVDYSADEIRIQFTVWDSVLLVLPPFILDKNAEFSSQALMLQVNFPKVDENGEIADIHEITFETVESSEFMNNFWWLLDLFVVILFFIGLFLVLSIKASLASTAQMIQLSPEERALSDLEKLMQLKQFHKEEQKLHFAEFSDILRRYIGARYNFITFEKTTNEIVSYLKKKRLESRFIEQFGVLLNLADMIKFSKATTDEAEIEQAYQTAKDLIQKTTEQSKKGDEDA
jgi:hypothetical protein